MFIGRSSGILTIGDRGSVSKRIHLFEKIAALPTITSTIPIIMREANFHEIIAYTLSIHR